MRLINKLERYLNDNNYEIIIKANSVNIMNFQEIIDFSSNKIAIRCEGKIINVEGNNLIISKMIDEEVLITGEIYNLRIN